MFTAFSQGLNKIISADNVQNYKDVFLCPNPTCSAKLTLRAVNSSIVSPHFACSPNHPHAPNCLFGLLEDIRGAENENCIKSDIMTILNSSSLKASSPRVVNSSNKPMHAKKYIRTAKQLLNYCLSNDLSTEYTNGLTVGDIVLDSRNLLENKNYKGLDGIRLLSGQTVKYCEENKDIKISVSTRTSTNKRIWINAFVYLPLEWIKKITSYLLNTPPKQFSGHPIAVLAQWRKDKDYQISTIVTKESNVIYRFIHE